MRSPIQGDNIGASSVGNGAGMTQRLLYLRDLSDHYGKVRDSFTGKQVSVSSDVDFGEYRASTGVDDLQQLCVSSSELHTRIRQVVLNLGSRKQPSQDDDLSRASLLPEPASQSQESILSKSQWNGMALIGGALTGKTWLMQSLLNVAIREISDLSTSDEQDTFPLPLFVPALKLAKYDGSVHGYIKGHFSQQPAVASMLSKALSEGLLMLFVDSLDDLARYKPSLVESFLSKASQHKFLVLTAREQVFRWLSPAWATNESGFLFIKCDAFPPSFSTCIKWRKESLKPEARKWANFLVQGEQLEDVHTISLFTGQRICTTVGGLSAALWLLTQKEHSSFFHFVVEWSDVMFREALHGADGRRYTLGSSQIEKERARDIRLMASPLALDLLEQLAMVAFERGQAAVGSYSNVSASAAQWFTPADVTVLVSKQPSFGGLWSVLHNTSPLINWGSLPSKSTQDQPQRFSFSHGWVRDYLISRRLSQTIGSHYSNFHLQSPVSVPMLMQTSPAPEITRYVFTCRHNRWLSRLVCIQLSECILPAVLWAIRLLSPEEKVMDGLLWDLIGDRPAHELRENGPLAPIMDAVTKETGPEQLLQWLLMPSARLRETAAKWFLLSGFPDAGVGIELLRILANSQESNARKAAAAHGLGLLKCSDESVWAALSDVSCDHSVDSMVHEYALTALRQHSPVSDAESGGRLRALALVAAKGTPDMASQAKIELSKPANSSLAILGLTRVGEALDKQIVQLPADQAIDIAEAGLGLALSGVADPQVVAMMRTLLSHSKGTARQISIYSILEMRIYPDGLCSELCGHLRDVHPPVRIAVSAALSSMAPSLSAKDLQLAGGLLAAAMALEQDMSVAASYVECFLALVHQKECFFPSGLEAMISSGNVSNPRTFLDALHVAQRWLSVEHSDESLSGIGFGNSEEINLDGDAHGCSSENVLSGSESSDDETADYARSIPLPLMPVSSISCITEKLVCLSQDDSISWQFRCRSAIALACSVHHDAQALGVTAITSLATQALVAVRQYQAAGARLPPGDLASVIPASAGLVSAVSKTCASIPDMHSQLFGFQVEILELFVQPVLESSNTEPIHLQIEREDRLHIQMGSGTEEQDLHHCLNDWCTEVLLSIKSLLSVSAEFSATHIEQLVRLCLIILRAQCAFLIAASLAEETFSVLARCDPSTIPEDMQTAVLTSSIEALGSPSLRVRSSVVDLLASWKASYYNAGDKSSSRRCASTLTRGVFDTDPSVAELAVKAVVSSAEEHRKAAAPSVLRAAREAVKDAATADSVGRRAPQRAAQLVEWLTLVPVHTVGETPSSAVTTILVDCMHVGGERWNLLRKAALKSVIHFDQQNSRGGKGGIVIEQGALKEIIQCALTDQNVEVRLHGLECCARCAKSSHWGQSADSCVIGILDDGSQEIKHLQRAMELLSFFDSHSPEVLKSMLRHLTSTDSALKESVMTALDCVAIQADEEVVASWFNLLKEGGDIAECTASFLLQWIDRATLDPLWTLPISGQAAMSRILREYASGSPAIVLLAWECCTRGVVGDRFTSPKATLWDKVGSWMSWQSSPKRI